MRDSAPKPPFQRPAPLTEAGKVAQTGTRTNAAPADRRRRKVDRRTDQGALAQLEGMTRGKSDPNYAGALEAVRQASRRVSGMDPATGDAYAGRKRRPGHQLRRPAGGLSVSRSTDSDDSHRCCSRSKQPQELARGGETLRRAEQAEQRQGQPLRSRRGTAGQRGTKNSATGLEGWAAARPALVGGLDELSGGAEALRTRPR